MGPDGGAQDLVAGDAARRRVQRLGRHDKGILLLLAEPVLLVLQMGVILTPDFDPAPV